MLQPLSPDEDFNILERLASAEKALKDSQSTKEFWRIIMPVLDFYEPDSLPDWPVKLRELVELGLERDRQIYPLPEETQP